MATSYRVVSEIRRHGDRVDIPDLASSVDVEPVGPDGRVRVTYLMPTQQLDVGEESDPEPEPTYLD
jgi:hypothetical protein